MPKRIVNFLVGLSIVVGLLSGCAQTPLQVDVAIDKSASNTPLLESQCRTLNALYDESLGGMPVRITTFAASEKIYYDGLPDDSESLVPAERNVIGMPEEFSTSVELAMDEMADGCRRKAQQQHVIVLLTDGGFTNPEAFQRSASALAACDNIKAVVLIGVQPGDRVNVENVLKPIFGDRLLCASETDRAALPEKLRPLLR